MSDRDRRRDRRDRRRALWLQHERELRHVPKHATYAAAGWYVGLCLYALALLGIYHDEELRRLFITFAPLIVYVFGAPVVGFGAIIRWRRQHPPANTTWVRDVHSDGYRSPWRAVDPFLGFALLFGSLPVGLYAFGKHTVMGLIIGPFRGIKRMRRHSRERKAI